MFRGVELRSMQVKNAVNVLKNEEASGINEQQRKLLQMVAKMCWNNVKYVAWRLKVGHYFRIRRM